MEHKNLVENINKLVNIELENARNRFNNINSSHEGYAVILEEFEEVQEEIVKFEQTLQTLWKAVKNNSAEDQSQLIKTMENISTQMIKESIQIAAMCKRFNEDLLTK